MSRLASAGALLLASALAGCGGPIGGSGYPGDPQLVLHGQVTSTDEPGPKEIVFVWQLGPPPSMDQVVPDLRGGVPQSRSTEPWFTIRLYDSPPWSLPLQRLQEGEVAFARGNLVAIPLGWRPDPIDPPIVTQEPGFGASVGHWVVYLDGRVEAGTLTAWWLGAESGIGPGYRLVRVDPFPAACMTEEELEQELDACVTRLVAAGVADDQSENPGTARGYCRAPYRLSPADPWGTSVNVQIGAFSVPPPDACPTP
jgi:hypothetical protein